MVRTMKQLYIEVEELAARLLMDLNMEPGTVAYDAVYPGVVTRLTEWVDCTILGAPFPTETLGAFAYSVEV